MKTPREILFERHRAVGPKLDALRGDVVAGLNRQGTKVPRKEMDMASLCLGGFKKLWCELVLPSRRVWSGLAAVWVVIIAINLADRDSTPAGKISTASPTVSFREEQKVLNELFADRVPVEAAEPPKVFSPRPRTEKFQSEIV